MNLHGKLTGHVSYLAYTPAYHCVHSVGQVAAVDLSLSKLRILPGTTAVLQHAGCVAEVAYCTSDFFCLSLEIPCCLHEHFVSPVGVNAHFLC